MSEIRLRGQYTPDEYKEGEMNYRLLQDDLRDWRKVEIGFLFPDPRLGKAVPVKGEVVGVFRDKQTPFATLPHLDYDTATQRLWRVTELFESTPTPRLDDILSDLFEMAKQAGRGLHSVETVEKLGSLPTGVCFGGQVDLNLAYAHIHMIHCFDFIAA